MMKRKRQFISGLLLIIIGVLMLINALGIATVNIFFKGWWTLFIIVPSLIGIIEDKDKTGNIVAFVIGCALFLGVRGILDFKLLWKLCLPIILIMIGLVYIFSERLNKEDKAIMKKLSKHKADSEYCAVLSSRDEKVSDTFNGSDLTGVFGSVRLDLTKAKIKKECLINAASIFGKCEVVLPDDVNVKISSTSAFGSVVRQYESKSDSKNTIYIECVALFGSVIIK